MDHDGGICPVRCNGCHEGYVITKVIWDTLSWVFAFVGFFFTVTLVPGMSDLSKSVLRLDRRWYYTEHVDRNAITDMRWEVKAMHVAAKETCFPSRAAALNPTSRDTPIGAKLQASHYPHKVLHPPNPILPPNTTSLCVFKPGSATIRHCKEVFPVAEYACTTIPTYPSGQIGFTVCCKDALRKVKEPLRSWDLKKREELRR